MILGSVLEGFDFMMAPAASCRVHSLVIEILPNFLWEVGVQVWAASNKFSVMGL